MAIFILKTHQKKPPECYLQPSCLALSINQTRVPDDTTTKDQGQQLY